jgi:isoquinoline 1-oxidoreductase alpha subunit
MIPYCCAWLVAHCFQTALHGSFPEQFHVLTVVLYLFSFSFNFSNVVLRPAIVSLLANTYIILKTGSMIQLTVNRKEHTVDAPPDMPLLWVLRDILGLTGTKFGCGKAQCGACTVHLNGNAVRSCIIPLARAAGQQVVTIEGLSPDGTHPLQQAWQAEDVPQCGYCQSGQIMSAAVLLRGNSQPSDADIDGAMSGNICRCGTYPRIRKAIHLAARIQRERDNA